MGKYKGYFAIVILVILLMISSCVSYNDSAADEPGEENYSDDAADQEELDYDRALAARNQTFHPEDAEIIKADPNYKPEAKKYTVMVYMVGSNLESNLGNATADMEEMVGADLDYEKNNLIVFTGGSRRWTGNIPADQNCVVDFSREEENRIVGYTKGNADMGAPETLSSFLNYVKDNYPSDHYALICWDHGGGPLWGFGSDELFNNDSLLLTELKKVLKEGPFQGEKRLDWVGFDACLMGSYESMHVWAGHADYYVGSEEVEPGDGWDYSFLKILNTTSDPIEITSSIVDSYYAYYEGKKTNTFNPDLTISVADLSLISDMDRTLKNLFQKLQSGYQGNPVHFRRLLKDTKSFGMVNETKGGEAFYYDLADISELNKNMSGEYEEESRELKDVLERFIIRQKTNVDGASGVALYFPEYNKKQFQKMKKIYKEDLSQPVEYYWFLEYLTKNWEISGEKDWTLGEIEREGEEYTLHLTSEQKESVISAYYTVLFKREDGFYEPLIRHCEAEIDMDGVVHAPADPRIFCVEGDSEYQWTVTQVEHGAERNVYRSDWCHLDSCAVGFHMDLPYAMQPVIIFLKEDVTTGEVEIQSVEGTGSELAFRGKNQIDLTHWLSLYQPKRVYAPAWNSKKQLLPAESFNERGVLDNPNLDLQDNLSFAGKPLSACDYWDGKCVIQFTVEDENEYVYASELQEISYPRNIEKYEVDTPKGKMEFKIQDKEAVLWDYNGSDEVLEIPDQVEGHKVVEVGGYALSSSGQDLKKVILPDSVESIAPNAFFRSSVEEIVLPHHLKKIGKKAFFECGVKKLDLPDSLEVLEAYAISTAWRLKEVKLSSGLTKVGIGNFTNCEELKKITGKCKGISVRDQVVFSNDGKKLIAYPGGKTEEKYRVPGGVEEIADTAFAKNSHITEVQLPEGVSTIGNNAFSGCISLKKADLPDSLKSIGMYAFDMDRIFFLDDGIINIEDQTVLHIGPNVTYIGEGSFNIFADRRFEVSRKNRFFREKGGAVMNKSGDAVIQSRVQGNIIYIPEGTLEIDNWLTAEGCINRLESFSNQYRYHGEAIRNLEIYIPSSVRKIANLSDDLLEEDIKRRLIIHCEENSAAEQFAINNGLNYNHNMEIRKETVKEKSEEGTFYYNIYDDYALLYHIDSSAKEITLPDKIHGVPLRIIGDGVSSVFGEEGDGEEPALEKLILPDTVTEISDNAFSSCSGLHQADLPAGLLRLGENSFDGDYHYLNLPDSLENLELSLVYVNMGNNKDGIFRLPDHLKYISPEAVNYILNDNIKGYEISEENGNFSCVDGVLFSKDHKKLIAFPQGRYGEETVEGGDVENTEKKSLRSYQVPEGTEEISKYAFYDVNIDEVILPESLKVICEDAFTYTPIRNLIIPDSVVKIEQNAFNDCEDLTSVSFGKGLKSIERRAFCDCIRLSEVTFGEGLQVIGDQAFKNTLLLSEIVLPDSLEKIGNEAFCDSGKYEEDKTTGEYHSLPPVLRGEESRTCHIGSSLAEIDDDAFACLNIDRYEVDPENETFSEVKGFLYDKTGTVLYKIPPGMKGEIHIPDGTLGIDLSFDSNICGLITDLYIPDSVQYVSYLLNVMGSGEEYVIHCSKDSPAARYAIENGIKCVEE